MALLLPIPIQRQFQGPIDDTLKFTTTIALNNYLTNNNRYSGQIVSCLQKPSSIFILNATRNNWIEINIDNKVDKITNKQLSTEDFTTQEKNKLANLTDYFKGYYADSNSRNSSLTNPQLGWYVLQGNTNTIWYYNGSSWVDTGSASSGDMLKSIYDPMNVNSNVYNVDNHIDGSTNRLFTQTDKTKLTNLQNYTLQSHDSSYHIDQYALIYHSHPIADDVNAGFILDVPVDDKYYLRKDQSWTEVDPSGALFETYTNTTPTLVTIGGIDSGSTFNQKSNQNMWDDLLYPELFPTLTNPSSTFNSTITGLREVNSSINITLTSTFNRGSINPAYGTSGYRSGLPISYNYSGITVTTQSLSNQQILNNYIVILGSQSWSCNVSYDGGEQPLSSKGNNFNTPLQPGSTSTITRTITGVYPAFACTVDISTMTKQPLLSMNSNIVFHLVSESDYDKQIIDIPSDWSTITGIEFYNTISGQWEWLNGSKLNSQLSFDQNVTTHNINGLTINYLRYTHIGPKVGSRQLRFRVD